MKRAASLVIAVWISACFAQASDLSIAFVSNHPGDNTPNSAAAGVGFTYAPDKGYTTLLANNGYTVTRFVTIDSATPAQLAVLNTFDLVIISRSTPSGHYSSYPGEVASWNGITAPLMLLNGYVARNSRLGFVTGANIPDTTNSISLKINDPAHPIFEGVSLDLNNTMVSPFAGIVTLDASFTNLVQRGISLNMDPAVAGGTTLATVATSGNTFGGTVIAEWAAGATTARGDTFGGPRLMFLTGSREAANFTGGDAAGVYDLTPDGELMFLNAVQYMATIPEPSTCVLLALGGLTWLLRRRS